MATVGALDPAMRKYSERKNSQRLFWRWKLEIVNFFLSNRLNGENNEFRNNKRKSTETVRSNIL